MKSGWVCLYKLFLLLAAGSMWLEANSQDFLQQNNLNKMENFFQSGIAIESTRTGGEKSYALVAGGSKGIGFAIAEALARRGYNLVLIARHLDSLDGARKQLETNYPVHVEILVLDLSRKESADEIATWCNEKNLPSKCFATWQALEVLMIIYRFP